MQEVERTNSQLSSMLKKANQIARRYGRIGTHEPEDIAQIAIMKAIKKTDGRPVNDAWLYKVVRTSACDLARIHVRELLYLTPFDNLQTTQSVCERADENGYVRTEGTFNTTREQSEPDLLPRLRATLEQLSEPLRRVLVLHAEGYSYEEIAGMTKTNLGTVRSRIHHARKKARILLDDIA